MTHRFSSAFFIRFLRYVRFGLEGPTNFRHFSCKGYSNVFGLDPHNFGFKVKTRRFTHRLWRAGDLQLDSDVFIDDERVFAYVGTQPNIHATGTVIKDSTGQRPGAVAVNECREFNIVARIGASIRVKCFVRHSAYYFPWGYRPAIPRASLGYSRGLPPWFSFFESSLCGLAVSPRWWLPIKTRHLKCT